MMQKIFIIAVALDAVSASESKVIAIILTIAAVGIPTYIVITWVIRPFPRVSLRIRKVRIGMISILIADSKYSFLCEKTTFKECAAAVLPITTIASGEVMLPMKLIGSVTYPGRGICRKKITMAITTLTIPALISVFGENLKRFLLPREII